MLGSAIGGHFEIQNGGHQESSFGGTRPKIDIRAKSSAFITISIFHPLK
jgi:hypothetical protein